MAESLAAALAPEPVAGSYQRQGRRDRWIRLLTNGLLALLVAAFAGAALEVTSGSWQARTVLTGSMVPELPVGSVVLTRREPLSELKVGDVFVFHRPDQPDMLVVHRVIALRATGHGEEVRTKGDANSVADPWNPFVLHGPYVYVARGDVPYMGYLVTDARSNLVRLMLFAGAALLVTVAVRYLRHPAPEEDHSSAAAGNKPSG